MEGSILFLLLILKATNLSSSEYRATHFQFSLYALLLINTVLIPQADTLIVFGPASGLASLISSPRTIVFLLVPVTPPLAFLSYFPFYTDASSPANLLSSSLSQHIVIGTMLLGLLSGFSAVMRAWDFLPTSTKKISMLYPLKKTFYLPKRVSKVLDDLERKHA